MYLSGITEEKRSTEMREQRQKTRETDDATAQGVVLDVRLLIIIYKAIRRYQGLLRRIFMRLSLC